ncbi:hypothetical protein TorRG33x02_060060 [Trema orientale]|uniref:Uncharacterized protein n=1 Tax=Trema orientale TaxID=63057 RepID=A0A2P5FK89_TREOI|nr:hypothetical protein TorRG33x02_060060 [Trema orientale]
MGNPRYFLLCFLKLLEHVLKNRRDPFEDIYEEDQSHFLDHSELNILKNQTEKRSDNRELGVCVL